MKKIFAMLLALAMLLGAMAMAEAVDVTGDWYCTEMIQGENSFNPADLGLKIVVTLNEDGTAIMDAGEPVEGTWTIDGDTVTLKEEGAPDTVMTLVDGNLVIEQDSVSMVLSREAAQGFTPAEAIEAAAIEDFNGTWEAYKAGAFGAYVDMSALGGTAGLSIEDGALTVHGTLFSGAEGQTVTVEFVDGALKVSMDDQGDLEICLLEDGTLRMNMINETMTVEIYLRQAEETPAA
ncbi:MAG: lipocalin family protein [Clostridia bacterium]|nr:lipocalin family protein [Clostridia bacterium]